MLDRVKSVSLKNLQKSILETGPRQVVLLRKDDYDKSSGYFEDTLGVKFLATFASSMTIKCLVIRPQKM